MTALPPQTKTKPFGIGIDIIWVLVILAGFLFFTSLIPLPPNDFWWHLRIGEYIYTNHTIPTTNIYAWTLPSDQPFFYAAWLGELLLYWLYKLGGLSLDIFIRTLLVGISFWLVAVEARRRSNSWRIAALVIAILCLMSTNNLPLRTQMWAWLPFVLIYTVLSRYSEGNLSWHWLVLCPVCMVFWVNSHGTYVLGLALPCIYLLGEALGAILKHPETLPWNKLAALGAASLLSGLAVLINPRFVGIIGYATNLMSNQPVQQLIEEWQSPTPQGIANVLFFMSILLFIVILAYSRYRLTPTELLLMSGFLWLAWQGQRSVIWYGMIAIPILARLIRDLPLKIPAFVPQRNWVNLVLAILLFIPALVVQPWFVERIPLPATYWQQVLRGSSVGPLLSVHTPVEAAEYLRTHPGGHLFHELGYGSYLIWAVPEQGVFIDPRIELYPYDQWQDYIHINNSTRYNEILSRYGVDRILLDKALQPELADSLLNDPGWKLEYEDPLAQIWSKVSNP